MDPKEGRNHIVKLGPLPVYHPSIHSSQTSSSRSQEGPVVDDRWEGTTMGAVVGSGIGVGAGMALCHFANIYSPVAIPAVGAVILGGSAAVTGYHMGALKMTTASVGSLVGGMVGSGIGAALGAEIFGALAPVKAGMGLLVGAAVGWEVGASRSSKF